ncbi:hypothetical protein BOTNAR_0162g00040 [Botryotinia narcissicola]|uniref:Uncharacterized protein n=1 Tax=Botryotinia narcissicola TaxID=278944 RepID=A0A4Z1IG01_9HELO|nr:hypothetical protein BOTNAR_0162g00040 [Botryotinia narcissicola]
MALDHGHDHDLGFFFLSLKSKTPTFSKRLKPSSCLVSFPITIFIAYYSCCHETNQPANQPSGHPANILKAQYAFGKAGHNVNETGRTVRTGRDSSNERVHIALEWAEDVDGLGRGLEGFGLDDD